jgi:lysophospholipase L1-like esterase
MHSSRRIRTTLAAVAAISTLAVAGCSGSSSSGGGTNSAPVTPSTSTSATRPATAAANLYVSVGDSYAAGYQPTSVHSGSTTRNGFAYQLVNLATAKGYHLKLTNFACAGATTASMLHSPGCKASLLGPGATSYTPKTQAAAAQDFVRAHRGQVALITVSIGGNDIVPCGASANPTSCVTTAIAKAKANLHTLLTGLRAAAGPQTKIVGTTYPDVFLGNELSTNAAAKKLASLSVLAFEGLINPALKADYESVGGSFVDVTAATGAYIPLTVKTHVAHYGTIPVATARICQLTYYCQYQDIHPRTTGYALIAKLIEGELPAR